MCGITGIWHFNKSPVDQGAIERFNDSLAHRGPDGKGISFHQQNLLAFGHRRLSILDLTDAGKQPMSYADNQLSITYNGEIFNFLELREELIKAGYAFKSQTDTEVVLAAYHKWGKDCFSRFNGMWAMAIWDSQKQQVILSRDRFGIKPLYYYFKPGETLYFASELKAFLALDDFRLEIDRKRVSRFTDYGAGLEVFGKTMYKGIFSLIGGHLLEVSSTTSIHQQLRWYNPKFVSNHAGRTSKQDVQEELRHLFSDSVGKRLRSDVPVATALSGGLDSSIVFSHIERLKAGADGERWNSVNNKAFINTIPRDENDEIEYANAVVNQFQGESTVVNLVNEQSIFDRIIQETKRNLIINNNPLFAVSRLYETMYAQGYRVSMDGHGVDELSFGYRDMLYQSVEFCERNIQPAHRKEAIKVLLGMYPQRKRADAEARLAQSFPWFKSFKQLVLNRSEAKNEELSLSSQPIVFPNRLESIAYRAFYSDSLPKILGRFDLAAMSSSIEIRMPFMDYRVVEFLQGLSYENHVADGFTKAIVRKALGAGLPDQIVYRTFKVGFQSPLSLWMQNGLDRYCEEYIRDMKLDGFRLDDDSDSLIDLFNIGKAHRWNKGNASAFWRSFNTALIFSH